MVDPLDSIFHSLDSSPSVHWKKRKRKHRLPKKPIKLHAYMMRKYPTRHERAVWDGLMRVNGRQHFRFQMILFGFIADIAYVPGRFIIEIDGKQHADRKHKWYDAMRTEKLNKHGWVVFRFTNEEVDNDLNGVLSKISYLTKHL